MNYPLILSCVFAFAISLTNFNLHAQSNMVSIGQKQFTIPGLSTLVDMSGNRRVMDWAAAAVEPGARLLGVSLDKDESGIQDLSIQRYIVLKTPRKFEQAELNEADFNDLKSVLKRSAGNLASLSDLANSRLSGKDAEMSKAMEIQVENMQVGVPLLLEVQRDEDRGYGYTYIAQYRANIDGQPKSWRAVSCGNTLLLKGKLLMINVYSLYRDARDLQWLRATCREFGNRVVAAN